VRSPRACRAVWPLPPCYCSLLQAGEKVSPRPGSSHSSPFAAPVQPVQPRRRNLTNKKPTACFLLSAASRAARRGLTGTLSFPPAPSLPNLRVVPITLCPPSTVPDFEQSAPIRVGDQGKKVNVDPSHRSPSVIHRVLPQVNRRLRAFYVLTGDRYEVYNTCNRPYKMQRHCEGVSGRGLYSSRLPPSRRPNRLRTPSPNSSERLRGMSPCQTNKRELQPHK
jgi:hypothetical protein